MTDHEVPMTGTQKLTKLRLVINENLRVQRGGADPVPYIDVGNVLNDIQARQNHVVFARRGCGKTLLLHYSSRQLDLLVKSVYLNCEDFKRHSFPNVLIEILDALFHELEQHLSGWFGKKKRSRDLIAGIRKELGTLRTRADTQEQSIRGFASTGVASTGRGRDRNEEGGDRTDVPDPRRQDQGARHEAAEAQSTDSRVL